MNHMAVIPIRTMRSETTKPQVSDLRFRTCGVGSASTPLRRHHEAGRDERESDQQVPVPQFAHQGQVAAGAVEAIFSILAIRDNVAPPTINLDNPSVETRIDLVPKQAKKKEINTVLSNSFGFGGTNASLIMRRFAA